MAPLTLLPPETLVYIFLRTTPLCLIRCRQVCKLFLALIDQSAELQYLLKLYCLGYVPPTNPRKDITYHEMVEVLEGHRKRWRGTAKKTTKQYPLRRVTGYTSTYDFYGGVYARGSTTSTSGDLTRCLDLYRLPSKNKSLEYKHWTHHDLGVDTRDFCMEPDLDLLVLVEMNDQVPIRDTVQGRPDATQYFTIHLRSLESCKPHPDAARPTIGHSLATIRASTRSFYFQVVGRYLAVLFLIGAEQSEENGTCQLKVWDWTTGKAVTHINIINADTKSFSFLSDRYIVMPCQVGSMTTTSRTLGRLEVYTFDEPLGDAPATAARHIASFHLPDLPDDLMYMSRLSCRVDPAPSPSAQTATRHLGCPRVYELAPTNRTLCLKAELTTINVPLGAYMISEGTLYVPFGSILDRIAELPNRVEQPPSPALDPPSDLPSDPPSESSSGPPSGLPSGPPYELLVDLLVDQVDQPADPLVDPLADPLFDLFVEQSDQPADQTEVQPVNQPAQSTDRAASIPWAEWGDKSSWLDMSGLGARNECFVFGQRVVTAGSDSDDEGTPTAVIFDFDPIRMRHCMVPDENESEIELFDPETDRILDHLYEEEDVLRAMFLGGDCKADVLLTMRTNRIGRGTGLYYVMINDEHVVVVMSNGHGQESSLVVHSF